MLKSNLLTEFDLHTGLLLPLFVTLLKPDHLEQRVIRVIEPFDLFTWDEVSVSFVEPS